VVVERVNHVKFSLLDFPEGMVVDNASGTLRWTPSVGQTDAHRITAVASDGYTKDEQTFEVIVQKRDIPIPKKDKKKQGFFLKFFDSK
jgi:hypothetical protein